ncbi:hypothetical protein FAI41_04780 [Acetobacteraceae bacterium]|nr:hypothetical protein FAI41_04780 [Acetobacteraceae bacterium]
MRKYLFQRSTLLGLFVISCALLGVYENFLDESNAMLLLTFGAGGLIPENWPIARKLLLFIAPILVHQIRQNAASPVKDKKFPF